MPVVAWTVQIQNIADGADRTALCNDANVLCGTDSIVAQYDNTTKLSYDDSNNWQVKSGDTVVLTANGYKNSYALTTTITELDLVDLEALNAGLSSPVSNVSNCDTTFANAVNAYTALQAPCEEVGNTHKDLPGACATGTNACVVGYEYSDEDKKCKVKLTYVEPTTGDAAFKAQHKRNHFKSIRKGGVVKLGSESDAEFEKRKFAQMRTYTREYFKQKMQDRIDDNSDNKKKHQMRKEERMPLSIAAGSDDFKPNLKAALVAKFGADRDVGIIVGPVNTASPEACATWLSSTDDKSDFDDEDKCITYDAAIDGATTDVHVLGNDDSYSVGGILVGDKYVPVVKQTLANANAETFEMSCWTGSAWAVQDKDQSASGTQHWVAGDEVPCTVSRSGIVVKVDTIVGSSVTGQVDGDKCDEGYGCADTDDDGVCDTPLTCEPCESPEANNAVDATVCAAQLCEAGTGYDAASVSFDTSLDPTVTNNDNCKECDTGTYNTGGNGQCVDYTECTGTTYFDPDHTSKTADRSCLPKTQCTIAVHCNDRGSTAGYIKPDETCTCNCDTSGYDGDKCQTDIATPVFSSSSTAQAINENSGAGQLVYTASANDNSGDVVTFSLSGADTALSIDSATGAVTLTANPDYETQDVYAFTVVATDLAGNSGEKAVTLAINNVDEVAPTITSGDTATAILESAEVGTTVYTATADDTADYSEGVTFSLGGTDANKFSINSGEVTLLESPNFEAQSSYSFTVIATDAAGNFASKTVSLTVLPDADKDNINDINDPCVYTGCTVQQLTDAYALLTSEGACSGSRRTRTHANVYGCKTAGCADETEAIKTAFDSLHTQCSA